MGCFISLEIRINENLFIQIQLFSFDKVVRKRTPKIKVKYGIFESVMIAIFSSKPLVIIN